MGTPFTLCLAKLLLVHFLFKCRKCLRDKLLRETFLVPYHGRRPPAPALYSLMLIMLEITHPLPLFPYILQGHWACFSYLRLHPVSFTVLCSQQMLSEHLMREWLRELIILKDTLKAPRQEIRERECGQMGVHWRSDCRVGEVFHNNIAQGEPKGDCLRWVVIFGAENEETGRMVC